MSMRARALAYYIKEAGKHPDGWTSDAAAEIEDCVLKMDQEIFHLFEKVRAMEKQISEMQNTYDEGFKAGILAAQ